MAHIKQYFNRTAQVLRDSTMQVLLMKGADAPIRTPRTLFTFNSQEDLNEFAKGCDADIGGTSTVHFELSTPQTPSPTGNNNLNNTTGSNEGKEQEQEQEQEQVKPTAVFWGDMRLGVKSGLEGKLRGGYAGFRNKTRPTMFGELTEDVSNHRYLSLRLRLGGDPITHNSYFCNIQTDGPITTDLWQHRIYFKKRDGSWEDIYIPFDNFVRTNSGEMSDRQIEMYKEKIRTIGISLLGGISGAAGRYELGIDSIGITNDEFIEPTARVTDEKEKNAV